MGWSRGADDLSEVVRQRLQALLAEIPPRRAADSEGVAGPGLADPAAEPAPGAGPPSGGNRSAAHTTDPGRRAAHSGRDGVRDAVADESPEPDPSVAARLPGQLVRLAPQLGQFIREHLIVVGVVVLTGVLWGGYNLLQARTTPVAVAAQPSVAVSGVPASSTPTPTSTARLLVHVLGEVRRPGVVTLAEGARVRDALAAAGGLTSRAKPGDLNLAAPVVDGSQLVIGRRGSRVSGTGTSPVGGASGTAKVDLNAATAEQLDALPGVGPVTAQKILAWRAAHQRFRSVTELQEVDGIGPKSYAEIAPLVRV